MSTELTVGTAHMFESGNWISVSGKWYKIHEVRGNKLTISRLRWYTILWWFVRHPLNALEHYA